MPLQYWLATTHQDFYGDAVEVADDGPYTTLASVAPERSTRAEVPGQQEVDVINVRVALDLDVTLWSKAYFDGRYWDLEAPPAKHYGSRHVQHQTLKLRLRTVDDG